LDKLEPLKYAAWSAFIKLCDFKCKLRHYTVDLSLIAAELAAINVTAGGWSDALVGC